jgi:cobalt/nickel transport system permease protein
MQTRLLDYVGRDSPWHRLDARWRLAGIVLACAGVVCLQQVGWALAALGLAVLALLTARLPAGWLLPRLGGIAAFLGLVVFVLPLTVPGPRWSYGPLALSQPGLHLAGLVVVKALTVCALVLLLLASAPLAHTLRAAHRLYLPDSLVHLLLLTHLHAYLLAEDLGKARIALRLRRFRNRMTRHSYRTLGNLAGALLVRSHERAERVGQALRTRGFQGRFRSLQPFHTTAADVLGFLLLTAIGLLPLLLQLTWGR